MSSGHAQHSLADFVRYFLGLGTFGFGGPIALGYFRAGILGASLVGLAFVMPSWLMVLGLSLLYVQFGGLWWMQALFCSIGATVIAIIAIAAYKLARSTNRRDPFFWGVFAVLAAVTVWAQAELAEFFLLAGLLAILVKAPPAWLKARLPSLAIVSWPFAAPSLQVTMPLAAPSGELLLQVLVFFAMAGAFVFGSGLAIVPFLYQGAVREYAWLTETQFLDAVAVAMITPGPVVITVAFIGFLVAGFWGAVVVLGQRAIYDLPTVLIALVSLAILLHWKVQEPILVTASGLAIWPLVRGG